MTDIGYKIIDRVGMPHVVEYIRLQLSDYDTTQLDWVKLLPLSKATLLHGECTFPGITPGRRVQHGYRIRASVNVEMAPPFSYEHWGRVASTDRAQGWISGEKTFYFADLEECAVHTLSHECFHFLRDSGQLDLKNTEANANWWGDQWLKSYKKLFD